MTILGFIALVLFNMVWAAACMPSKPVKRVDLRPRRTR